MKHIYKAIDFMKAPEKSFDSVKGKKLGEAFRFMLVVSIIFAVLNGIVGGLTTGYLSAGLGGAMVLPLLVVGAMVVSYVGIVVFLTLWGLWLHLWVYIFGARKGLEQTMKSVYYGYSPSYLLGWIPFISIITTIWSLIVQWMGVKKLHGITGERAALSMIIAILIPLVIAIWVLITFLEVFLPMAGAGTFDGLGGLENYLL
jgi:hypothetical protein